MSETLKNNHESANSDSGINWQEAMKNAPAFNGDRAIVTGTNKDDAPRVAGANKLKGKTMSNHWAERNPTQIEETKSFEQVSAENDGARVVQAGEEQIPEVDTAGVNETPESQQYWPETPTPPSTPPSEAPETPTPLSPIPPSTPSSEGDTGIGGLENQSASSDAEAAAMLAEAENGSSSEI
ncbi:hypothetical protein IKE84_02255 [Candidatus Saccharibacteria bacterium]|nr:hypothetical protein [Candidatus Saccharibacteria bacterium]